MPNSNKQTASYTAILKAGEKLFFKYGVRKTNVEDIARAADVSKMTFYRSFKNKIDLLECILQDIVQNQTEKYHAIMERDIPFEQRINQIILNEIENQKKIGTTFYNDIAADDTLREILDKHSANSLHLFMEDLKKAQKQGLIRSNLKPAFIMSMLQIIHEKYLDENFMKMFDNHEDAVAEMCNFFFYGIVKTENRQ